MADPILVARAGPVATLTLNRPDALNTLDVPMMQALVRITHELADDAALRLVVVRGAGRHFMAGGDLNTFAQRLDDPPESRRAYFQEMIAHLHAAIEHLHRMAPPVIAVAQGAVAGFGLSLVCACDLVLATEDAYFASAYRNIGITPDGGGTWSLPRIVGMRKALELMLLSERFDAAEALRLGIVNRVVKAEALDATLAQWTESIVTGPQLALGNVKRLVRSAQDRSLSEQLQAEATSFSACAAAPDFVEGIRAFLAKRPARFGGS